MKFQEFSSLFDLLKAFPTEQSAINFFERARWNGNVISPFAPVGKMSKVYKCKNNRYFCSLTHKYFNVRTGSIFQDSKLPLTKWIVAIYLFTSHKKGISSVQLAKDLGIAQKNAWFLLHRLRHAMGQEGFFDFPISNTAEMDETYVGGREANRHQSKRQEGLTGRSLKDKAVVFGIVERKGKAILKHVPQARKEHIDPIIYKNIKPGTRVVTDEFYAYHDMHKTFAHSTIKHQDKEYVRGEAHTNTVEALWSHVKWCITGSYRWTSKKHLQAYLEEIEFRYNRRNISEYSRVNQFLCKSYQGSLKWNELIGKNNKNNQYVKF